MAFTGSVKQGLGHGSQSVCLDKGYYILFAYDRFKSVRVYCDSKTGVEFTQLMSGTMGTCGGRVPARVAVCVRRRLGAAVLVRARVCVGARAGVSPRGRDIGRRIS